MKVPDVITIDFESFRIDPRPRYPPEPVSVAVKWPGKVAKFYAWGHVCGGNDSTYEEALSALKKAWHSGLPLLFQNAKFDLAIATEIMGLPMPAWDRIHDTMFLLFLNDPYAPSFSLKPSAERYLGMPPEEQDAVKDWLLAHQPVEGVKITEGGKNGFGAYIAYCPGNIVKPYCVGDVVRTEKLFKMLYRAILDRKMGRSYDTERELMPILLENERQGMRVDLRRLSADGQAFENILGRMDEYLGKKLGVPGINIDSDAQVSEALYNSGIVTDFVLTKTGQRSMAKDNLTIDIFNDQRFYRALTYRNKLAYSLATFIRPWLATARETKGLIHTDWRQVPRQGAGAVTGRMSSSPNFQNITKNIKEEDNGYQHPAFIKWAPELPSLRKYILPDSGQKFGARDFSQQELRILAEFEDSDLRQAYQANPNLDVHKLVQGLLADAGKPMERGAVKGFNFGILYGMGATGLSTRLGVSMAEARELIGTWNAVMPGVSSLVDDIKAEVRGGGEIVTWGGRRYGMPPPMTFGDGGQRDRDYVLLNYLIQGSGADATKRAMIDFYKQGRESRIMLSVHDEIGFSCPASAMKNEQRILAKCMSDLPFDVRMQSDGKAGPNWGEAKPFKDAK